MTQVATRVDTFRLVDGSPEAQHALRQWRAGLWTFGQAMMETVKKLVAAKQQVQLELNQSKFPFEG